MGMKLRRPDLEMDLTMGSNDTLLHMLDDGTLDAILISISESNIDRNSLEVLPLFHDDIFPPRLPRHAEYQRAGGFTRLQRSEICLAGRRVCHLCGVP